MKADGKRIMQYEECDTIPMECDWTSQSKLIAEFDKPTETLFILRGWPRSGHASGAESVQFIGHKN